MTSRIRNFIDSAKCAVNHWIVSVHLHRAERSLDRVQRSAARTQFMTRGRTAKARELVSRAIWDHHHHQ